MQMTIDADKRGINKVKFDFDRALISHHILEAGGDEVGRHILYERGQPRTYEYDRISCL